LPESCARAPSFAARAEGAEAIRRKAWRCFGGFLPLEPVKQLNDTGCRPIGYHFPVLFPRTPAAPVFLATLLSLLVVVHVRAQRASPHETVTAKVDGAAISISYGRPYTIAIADTPAGGTFALRWERTEVIVPFTVVK
jgi:hypothetical protein